MEKAREFLELTEEESESVSRVTIPPPRVDLEHSFYENFALRGIRVDRVEPGFVACTFKVPPRLTVQLQTLSMKSVELTEEESESVSRVTIPPPRVDLEHSFYENFALRGIRVDRVEPGFVACTFKVPPRLTDRTGKLASGAIANLVDEVGGLSLFKLDHTIRTENYIISLF
ncbi:hypothetical protein CJ030_MR1G005298 [Morella rubra]|uniref:Uncharacterized protein n=1 Tax=Morella rubra TaxID=262757 RepID=A0A6A1WM32_9ROSI|nr:hypothetical protein CJ030_MR1G005298 [Morella rubra]